MYAGTDYCTYKYICQDALMIGVVLNVVVNDYSDNSGSLEDGKIPENDDEDIDMPDGF